MRVSVSPNPQNGSIWVAERGQFNVPIGNTFNRLYHIDSNGNTLQSLDLDDLDPIGVACHPKTGTAWVAVLRRGVLRVSNDGERKFPLLPIPATAIAIGRLLYLAVTGPLAWLEWHAVSLNGLN